MLRYIILLGISILLHAMPIAKASISWGDTLFVTLDAQGLHCSDGVHVFASFELKDERFRSADISKIIHYPLHPYLLAYHQHTIYILDLQREKMIGRLALPKRGTPRFIKIEPHKNGFTSLRAVFSILPPPGTQGRPGPPIHKTLIYHQGEFVLKGKTHG